MPSLIKLLLYPAARGVAQKEPRGRITTHCRNDGSTAWLSWTGPSGPSAPVLLRQGHPVQGPRPLWELSQSKLHARGVELKGRRARGANQLWHLPRASPRQVGQRGLTNVPPLIIASIAAASLHWAAEQQHRLSPSQPLHQQNREKNLKSS